MATTRFSEIEQFIINLLDVKLISDYMAEDLPKQTHEGSARGWSQKRDNGSRRDDNSGSFCSLIDLPYSQMAHIIPADTVALSEKGIWFWFILAMILPADDYLQVWQLCGGPLSNYLANVITLSSELHKFYDSGYITFDPIAYDEQNQSLTLRLEVPAPPISFYSLRDKRWEEDPQQPYLWVSSRYYKLSTRTVASPVLHPPLVYLGQGPYAHLNWDRLGPAAAGWFTGGRVREMESGK